MSGEGAADDPAAEAGLVPVDGGADVEGDLGQGMEDRPAQPHRPLHEEDRRPGAAVVEARLDGDVAPEHRVELGLEGQCPVSGRDRGTT